MVDRDTLWRTLDVQRLLSRLTYLLLAALAVCWASESALAVVPPEFPREQHAWARFEVGAWKNVRMITETLDAQGEVVGTSTTTTKTYLCGVFDGMYTLQVEVTVDVAGKIFEAEPQLLTHGFHGELEGESAELKETRDATVTIDGKNIACKMHEYIVNGEDRAQVMKIYYADKVAPYLLKKESVATDATGESQLHTTTETVVAIDMPFKVLARTRPTSMVKKVRENSKGRTTTVAVHDASVPGGIVWQTSKELNASGDVIRRSTLGLVDYGLTSDRKDFPRKRVDRTNKKRRRRRR